MVTESSSNSAPDISGNYIDRVDIGIYCESAATPLIRNNSLACADEYGVFNADSTVTVDARDNWWGDDSGPAGSGPGTGSRVGNHILFDPWLNDYPNRAPLAFSLLSPENGSVLDTIPTLDWETSVDPDCHDVITYSAYIDEDPGYGAPVVLAGLTGSECVFPESLFVGGRHYFWKVEATDGDSLRWSTQLDWGFAVDPTPPGVPQGVGGEGLGTSTQVYWDPNSEHDLVSYNVYRGLDSIFTAGEAETVYVTSDTTLTVGNIDPYTVFYYFVTAVDIASNESDPSPGVGVCAAGAAVAGTSDLRFYVSEATPSPASDVLQILLELPSREHVQAVIFDVAGRHVVTLLDERLAPGRHPIIWRVNETRHHTAASGVYFCRIQAGSRVVTRKVVLAR